MEQNQIYQNITCLDLTTDFQGTTMIEGKKVFIENFLPTEIADIKITKIKSKFIKGEIERLIQPSAMRKNSLVEQYPKSTFGGCDLQMINYPAQLQIKKQLTEKTAKLQDRAGVYTFEDVIASPEELFYRNKIHYQLFFDEKTQIIQAGFYRKGTRDFIEVDTNFLAETPIAKMLAQVLQKLNERGIKIADRKQDVQGLKAMMFRYSAIRNEMMVIFIGTTKDIKGIERVAKELQREHKRIKSVYLNVNGKNKGNILGDKTILLAGKETIEDEVLGFNFNISPQAFYQVNSQQTANIYQQVKTWVSDYPEATVLDFYTGIGTMSTIIADSVKEVIGIDVVKEAIAAAKTNAGNNNITNVSFIAADVNDFIKEYQTENNQLIALIDPPRSGCSQTFIENLTELQPEKVIYVSCNPKTLIRDLQLFREQGYEYDNIKLYDMFPQTLHLESAVTLTRSKRRRELRKEQSCR